MYINAEGCQNKSNDINRIERKDRIDFRNEIKYRIKIRMRSENRYKFEMKVRIKVKYRVKGEDEDNREIVYINGKGCLIPMTPRCSWTY